MQTQSSDNKIENVDDDRPADDRAVTDEIYTDYRSEIFLEYNFLVFYLLIHNCI